MATSQSTRDRAGVYTDVARPVVNEYEVSTTVMPVDRVRWAAILGGLFTVLAALVVFTVLGIALGLSTFDANNPRSLGIGVGIYGIISALVAFALGGFIAARTAAVSGRSNAILQAVMVWVVTIALIVNFIGSGVGTLLNIAGSAANTAIVATSNVAGDAAEAVAENPGAQATLAQAATEEAPSLQATVAAVPAQVQEQLANVSPEEVEQAARNASSAAWGTLIGLVVSMVAALVGGLAGARRRDVLVRTGLTP